MRCSSTSFPSSRTTRSWIGAGGDDDGTGGGAAESGGADVGTRAVTVGAGDGATMGVAAAIECGGIYTYCFSVGWWV